MTTTWHADETLLAAYADGAIDAARASSLEAHVLACAPCRAALSAHADPAALTRMWAEVTEVVDAPRPGVIERALRAVGVPDHAARLLSATPSLRLSWLIAEAVALGQAVVLANVVHGGPREDVAMLGFLVLAALLPVLGVAFAYGPGVDPAYEMGIAAPMWSGRLLLIRSTAVLGASIVFAGLGALAVPWRGWEAVAWLVPSLGLTLATLALSTAIRPRIAAAGVATGWVLFAVILQMGSGDRLAAFRSGAQLVFVTVIVVSAWVLARRREAFEEGAFR